MASVSPQNRIMVPSKADITISLTPSLFTSVKTGGTITPFVSLLKKRQKITNTIVSDEDIKSVCIMCFVAVVVHTEIPVEFYHVVIHRLLEAKLFIFSSDVWNYVILVITMHVSVEVGQGHR